MRLLNSVGLAPQARVRPVLDRWWNGRFFFENGDVESGDVEHVVFDRGCVPGCYASRKGCSSAQAKVFGRTLHVSRVGLATCAAHESLVHGVWCEWPHVSVHRALGRSDQVRAVLAEDRADFGEATFVDGEPCPFAALLAFENPSFDQLLEVVADRGL